MNIEHTTEVRVIYGDTDKMGVVYYGNYPKYYEIGRTELMRNMGLSYKDLENQGIFMPVTKMQLNYKRSAFYDDILLIKTSIKDFPGAVIRFHYEVFSKDKNELLNFGWTDLAFINDETNRPCRPPNSFLNAIKEKINS